VVGLAFGAALGAGNLGPASDREAAGDTAAAVIRALETSYPALRGWIVDERGALRRHVKLFLRGVAVSLDKPVGPNDELYIIAAISGG